MSVTIEDIAQYTTEPGIYQMKNAHGQILYIGKAKNLRIRIRQYFIPGRDSRAMVIRLMKQVTAIEVIVVLTEKEALILENNLIKQHQPKYNVMLKDDKGYVRLFLSSRHAWPMLQVVRYKGQPKGDGVYFGPYHSAYAARQILNLVQRIFPLRRCSDQELRSRSRPCLLYQMKRCIAPCVGFCTQEQYQEHVRHVTQFLRGKSQEVLDHLQEQRDVAADKLEFERAAELHKIIELIKASISSQLVDQVSALNTDVFGIYREADEVLISQLLVRQGKLVAAKHYPQTDVIDEDQELLESFLMQHYLVQQELPHEILLPLELPHQEAIEEVLSDGRKRQVQIMTPQRGNKTALLEMAQKNAFSAFQQEKEASRTQERILLEMQEKLQLLNYPQRIDCFDNSHLGGSHPVAAMVVYQDGIKTPALYRKYHLRSVDPSDDYGAMQEVLMRRYRRAKEEDCLPDLIVIDGGKGHLNTALKVLQELNITGVDVIGLAKEGGRHDKGTTEERIFLPNATEPIALPKNSPLLFLLQRIRDETHRVVITFQRNLRSKKTIKTDLQQISGIGPIKKQRLFAQFGSLKQILLATEEQLQQVQGITKKDLAAIEQFRQKEQQGL